MRKAALLIVILTTIHLSPGWSAEPKSDDPYEDLSGEWKGTASGAITKVRHCYFGADEQGADLLLEGAVDKFTLLIQVNDEGHFKAAPDHEIAISSLADAIGDMTGQIDKKFNINASQSLRLRLGEVVQEANVEWHGIIKRGKKKLKLNMTGSTELAHCGLHITLKASKAQ